MKYNIPIQVKQYEKKCSFLIFLMKNEKKKTEKVIFLSTISMLCSLGFIKKYHFYLVTTILNYFNLH